MNAINELGDTQEREPDQIQFDDAQPILAWEQIEAGRFMPRRIRGSYRGGKLG
jgi:hypothetical protein